MPRFFVRQESISDGNITVVGEDAHHIARSLRMALGEIITVCDMQGNEYQCEITSFEDDKRVNTKILSQKHSSNEPRIFVTLFQALPKGDKLDGIIQKSVECGVSQITTFQSERCVARIKEEAEEKKLERRRRIAAEAAKQCGRSVIPSVNRSITFKEALSFVKDYDVVLFCYEGEDTEPLGQILNRLFNPEKSYPEKIAVFIGSEGGFSIDEARLAKESGALMTGLGKRILRTETASGFVLSCIVCFSEL